MANIHQNLLSLIGNTPLMEVQNIAREENLKARVIVKIESRNPGGSVKDRVALAMVEDAEKQGMLKPGGTLIEPTDQRKHWHRIGMGSFSERLQAHSHYARNDEHRTDEALESPRCHLGLDSRK